MAVDHNRILIHFLTPCCNVWKDYLKKKKKRGRDSSARTEMICTLDMANNECVRISAII